MRILGTNLNRPANKREIIHRLIIGTASFGMDYGVTNKSGKVPFDEVISILDECRKNEITELDTAAAYGQAEKILGEAGVNDFSITTKISLNFNENPQLIQEKTNQSLKRLKVSKVQNILLHNEERLNQADGKEIATNLRDIIRKGLARRVGISSYDPVKALEICKKFQFGIAQLPANILDRRIFKNNLNEDFRKAGILIQARSVFLQGILLAEPKKKEKVSNMAIKFTRLFRSECVKNGISPLTAALGYLLKNDDSIKILIGVSSCLELKEIIKATSDKSSLYEFPAPKWNKALSPVMWRKKNE
jgi:hypothetical protein